MEDSLAMVREIISNEKWSIRSRRPRTTLYPEDFLYSTGFQRHNMMQVTNVSRILRRPGMVVRKPLVSPGLCEPTRPRRRTGQTQTGHRRCPDLPGAGGACEERGVDYCNGEHHKCGQHSKSHGEVFPWNRYFGVQVGKLQNDDHEGRETAEAPAEHAPSPLGTWLHSGCPLMPPMQSRCMLEPPPPSEQCQ